MERWAKREYLSVVFDDHVRQYVIRDKPEAIFIGNSTLSENVPSRELQQQLSSAPGELKPLLYIAQGGMHSAWEYLVLKNQVATTGSKDIPVVIINYEDFFLRPDAKVTNLPRSEYLIRSNMLQDEPVLLEKLGSKARYFRGGFPYFYSQRFNLKRKLAATFVKHLMDPFSFDVLEGSRSWQNSPVNAIQWLLGGVFKGTNFRSGSNVDEAQTSDREPLVGSNEEEFKAIADKSFLPEMLSYSNRFKIIIVQSNSNPNMPIMKAGLKRSAPYMRRYVESHGGTFINLNDAPELQQPGLMHDSRHFAPGDPRILNVTVLVRELKKTKLF